MIVKANDVIGLKVFSVDEGKEVDAVEDVIYNPSASKIEALLVDSGGIFSSGQVIAMEDVKSIGDDAVIIQSESMMKSVKELPDDIRHIAEDDTHLTKAKVMTEQGKDLGKVSDLLFDPDTGEVVELEVSQGGWRDMQSGRRRVKLHDVTTVGEDALIVKSFTEVEFGEQAEKGGMMGALNRAKESTQEAVDDVKRQWESPETQHRLQKAKDNMRSVVDEGEQKLQQGADQAKGSLESAKHDPENQRKMSEAGGKLEEAAESVRLKAEELTASAKSAVNDKKSENLTHKEDEAVGQYITRNVLDRNDMVVAARGEVVTHDILDAAKEAGVEDVVLGNLSQRPVGQTAGMLGGEVEKDRDDIDPVDDDLLMGK